MAPPSSGNNRLWLVIVAVAAVLVLVGAGTTAAVLVLRNQSEDDPQAGPFEPRPPTVVNTPTEGPTTGPTQPPTSAPVDPPSGDGFDLTRDPTFGEETISSGFLPDPATFEMRSGGTVDASYLGVSGCRGYGAQAPDFRLQWEGEGRLLRFFFLPDETGDTGLVINAPDGSWNCNDDSFGTLNPTVEFASSRPGRYDIWVTTYATPGQFIEGTLRITELSSVTPAG